MKKILLTEISRMRQLMSLPEKDLLIEVSIPFIDDIVKRGIRGLVPGTAKMMKDMLPDILIRIRDITKDFTISFGTLSATQQDEFFSKLIRDTETKIGRTLKPEEKINVTNRLKRIVAELDDAAKDPTKKNQLIKGADEAATSPKPDAGGVKVKPDGGFKNKQVTPNGSVIYSNVPLEDYTKLVAKQAADTQAVSRAQRLINRLGLSGMTRNQAVKKLFDHLRRNKYSYIALVSIVGGLLVINLLYPEEPLTQEEANQAEDIINDAPTSGEGTDIGGGTGGETGGGTTDVNTGPDSEGIYRTKGDPYVYRVVNCVWQTKGGRNNRLPNWVNLSLPKYERAVGILDGRFPNARKECEKEIVPDSEISTGEYETKVPDQPEISGEVNYTDPNNLP